MKRVVEPEVMSEAEQAEAYAQADFESAHRIYPQLFAERFAGPKRAGLALDLGCGPGDVTIRFARLLPKFKFHAVDGSAAMLAHGRRAIRAAGLSRRIKLIEGFIPGVRLPRPKYDLILSSSFLHHLHEPQILWQTVKQHGRRGTMVFVPDLRRPTSAARARAMVREYSGGEPEVLRRDFYNSLRAAFTPAEVRRQLRHAGLGELKVEIVTNRHLVVWGVIKGGSPPR